MIPPPEFNYTTHLPDGRANVDAPLKDWSSEGSFDSARECRAELQSNIKFSKQINEKVRRDESEQQESAQEEEDDKRSNAPKGFHRGLRGFGLVSAVSAQCIATDDPRLKEK